ncbi:hypothetical protein OROMI_028624 [Orobanche minor]
MVYLLSYRYLDCCIFIMIEQYVTKLPAKMNRLSNPPTWVMWPYVNEVASELIKTNVEPVLEQYRQYLLAYLTFSKVTLGMVAPQFTDSCSSLIVTVVLLSSFSAPIFVTDEEVIKMILFSVVNEACRVLDDGVVILASNLDVASLLGMSFPSCRSED